MTPPVVPQPVPPAPVEASTPVNLRAHALLPAIAGGVLLAAGGVSLGLSTSERSKLRNVDPALDNLEAARATARRGRTYQTVGFGLMAAGVVGLSAATGLYVLGAPAESSTLGVTTDGTSAFVFGRWP